MRRARPPIGRIVTVIACALTLLATAVCGARWDADQKAEVAARQQRGAGGGIATGDAAGSGDAAVRSAPRQPQVTRPPRPPAAPAAAPPGVVAAQAPTRPPGPARAAPASTAPGVTDKEIRLGTISTLSGAVPGWGPARRRPLQAYVAYRNSTGGVCGRQLVLKTADDGMDNGRHRSLATQMSSEVLGLIGGLGGGDAGSGEVVAAKGMPVVTTPISDGVPERVDGVRHEPAVRRRQQGHRQVPLPHDQGVRTAALVYIAVEQTRSEVKAKQRPQMEAAGIKVVLTQELPLSTLSFDSAARAVANSKADYLLFVSEAGRAHRWRSRCGTPGTSSKFAGVPRRLRHELHRARRRRRQRHVELDPDASQRGARAMPSKRRSSSGWTGSRPAS